jgi:hypothetical protein
MVFTEKPFRCFGMTGMLEGGPRSRTFGGGQDTDPDHLVAYFHRGPGFMKRSGVSVIGAFLVSLIVGCDGGGLKEGPPPEPVKSQQSEEFKQLMQKSEAKKAMMKGKMGNP